MSSEHKKLLVDFFVMSVTEFNTKILEAFVIERKVSFLLMVKYPVRNVCTNSKLKTVQINCDLSRENVPYGLPF